MLCKTFALQIGTLYTRIKGRATNFGLGQDGRQKKWAGRVINFDVFRQFLMFFGKFRRRGDKKILVDGRHRNIARHFIREGGGVEKIVQEEFSKTVQVYAKIMIVVGDFFVKYLAKCIENFDRKTFAKNRFLGRI